MGFNIRMARLPAALPTGYLLGITGVNVYWINGRHVFRFLLNPAMLLCSFFFNL